MINFSKPLFISALLTVTALPFCVQADDDKAESAFKVALWGDEFYSKDADVKASNIAQVVKSMNEHHVKLTIFAGDTKNGSSECSDAAITTDVETIFNSLKAPTLYTLGDNEWTDCHRGNNGAYDPLERLSYLRAFFFNKNTTQGTKPIPVVRQGALGDAYSENSRFVKNNVEFVALHIPGSNNNLVASEKECTKKTGREGRKWDSVNNAPLEECADATAEYQARNAMNLDWLHNAFDEARTNNYAGVLIAIQADIYFPFELSDGGYEEDFLPSLDPATNGYADFFHALVEETHNYAGKVLLVHGDSHYFKVDKAMFNDDGTLTANFTRVEVFGSADHNWVEMTVDPKSENVFDFKPVILQ